MRNPRFNPDRRNRPVTISGLIANHPEMGEVYAVAKGEANLDEACVFEAFVSGGPHDGAPLSLKCLDDDIADLEGIAVHLRREEEEGAFERACDDAYDEWRDR